jgi:hypothetical protein
MSKEIEMYLEKNHLSYNSAIRNNVGELVGIGDLIDQNTKPLLDEITTLESQFEQSDKMYSDLLAKKDDFKLKWENAENEIAKLKASKSEANEACLIQEIKKVLYESAKKTEIPSGGFEINIQFEEQAKALINQFKITR